MLVTPILFEVRPPTGKPDAGNPPVRFGGRGGRTQSALPTPIKVRAGQEDLESIAGADRRSSWGVSPFDSRQVAENLRPQPHGRHGDATVRQRIVEDIDPVFGRLHPQPRQQRVTVVGGGTARRTALPSVSYSHRAP